MTPIILVVLLPARAYFLSEAYDRAESVLDELMPTIDSSKDHVKWIIDLSFHPSYVWSSIDIFRISGAPMAEDSCTEEKESRKRFSP